MGQSVGGRGKGEVSTVPTMKRSLSKWGHTQGDAVECGEVSRGKYMSGRG